MAVLENVLNDFTSVQVKAIEKAVKAAGGTVQKYSANLNSQEQAAQCQDAITSQRFNTLIVAPVDSPTMIPCAKQAGEEGLTVLALENPIGSSRTEIEPQLPEVQGSVVISPETDAKAYFNAVKKACTGLPKCVWILEIAFASSPLESVKLEYFEEQASKPGSNIELADVLEGFYDPSEAVKKTPDALASHPDVDVYSYEADTSAVAAIPAFETAGMANKVKIISDGGSRAGVKAIEEGKLFATVGAFPRFMGEEVAKMAIELSEGKELSKTGIDMFELGKPIEIYKSNVH